MKIDQVETFGRCVLQHGPENDRIYLMKLAREDFPQILGHLNGLAVSNGYSKVFAKIPAYARERFEQNDYQLEASIPGFHNGKTDGLFMARYYHPDRLIDPDADRVLEVLEAAIEKAAPAPATKIYEAGDCRLALPDDCPQMAELYSEVFASYPFPVQDPDYLLETMTENVIYAGIWEDERLVALASAEVDKAGANAEMTDFATHPDFRGRGLANLLLSKLEKLMAEAVCKTCYTIARATSFGMNITFAQNGYSFAGTLIKNTQISGGLESMNVWYKRLPA
jgi:putative beta-lysine N-acetyltransferase